MNLKALLLMAACLASLSATAQHSDDTLDDLLQHAPMATVFVLKACGEHSQSSWIETTALAVASYAVGTAITYSGKQIIGEQRPDGSDHRSFPSGHATYAFAGATMLHHEYGHLSPWVTVGGYGLATLVALDRVRQDRHYLHDVGAGAAIGIASTELAYYLKRRFFNDKPLDLSFTGNEVTVRLYL